MRFFRCVAEALVKPGLKFAAKLANVDAYYEFALDIYNGFCKAYQEDDLRRELAAVAPLSGAEARVQAEAAIAAVAPQAPPEQQREMIDYLTLLPAQARSSLRRFDDPTGQTVPATQRFQSVEDLLPFLPTRLPLFKAGDRPPGVGDWELVELLGRGGFGEVWKARNPFSKSAAPVVLKFTTDESAIKMLRNEVGVLDRVLQCGQHPGIVRLHHTYLSAQYPCLEFEFVPGFELSALIRQLHAQQRPAWQAIHPWFVQLVDIVAFAHRAQIVHCDLKPANIFAHRQADGTYRLRVLDFGIGGLATYQAALETQRPPTSHSELLTKAARGAFTPLYASPQQKLRRRDQPADPRDDVHALGVIWYQMLTGDLAMVTWPSDWQDELTARAVPVELIALLGRCVASKEERRPANAAVLLAELKRHVAGAEKPGPKEPERKKPGIAPLPPGPGADPVTEYAQWKKQVDELKAQAQRAADVFDYARAVSILERVPAKHRDNDRMHLWTTKRDRLKEVWDEVEKNWRDMTEEELLAHLEEVVELHPDHPRAKPWLAQFGTKQERQRKRLTHGKVGDTITLQGMQFAWVPPGPSWLGGGGGKPGSTPFSLPAAGLWCGVYPVTQAEWQAVLGDAPSHFKNNPRYPVESVSWDRVQEFLVQLNKMAAGDGLLYRLPTEQEWEYICRGGPLSQQQQSAYHYYFSRSKTDLTPAPTNDLAGDKANFGSSQGHPSEVGLYLPNPLGIYDLHGNVWEWTSSPEGSARVVRGGSWGYSAEDCTAAYRGRRGPGRAGHGLGFRLLAVPSK